MVESGVSEQRKFPGFPSGEGSAPTVCGERRRRRQTCGNPNSGHCHDDASPTDDRCCTHARRCWSLGLCRWPDRASRSRHQGQGERGRGYDQARTDDSMDQCSEHDTSDSLELSHGTDQDDAASRPFSERSTSRKGSDRCRRLRRGLAESTVAESAARCHAAAARSARYTNSW